MNNKIFLTAHGIIYATFAVTLFFLPDVLWPLYGVEINDQYARFLSQHNSIFLGGIAILAYLFRDIEAGSDSARKLFKGLVYTNILGFLITLYACITSIFVGFGWSDPLFFAILAVLSFWQLKTNT